MAEIGSFGLDVGGYGPLAVPETILGLAGLAEDIGFDSIWLADHVAFPARFASRYPYGADGEFPTRLAEPLMETLATLGVLAGVTKRVRLGTAVLVMPYRNPVLLARMLSTIDNFSGGRVILGAGTGWLAEEFEVLQAAEFTARGRVTDEYIEIFKLICEGGEVSYKGETYSFDPVFSVPGSMQRPHPPVLIGGVTGPALRRTARHGDGWLAVSIDAGVAAQRLARLRELCGEHDRDFDRLQLVYKLFLTPGPARSNPDGRRAPGSGSSAEVIEDLKALADLGFGRFIVRYYGDSAAAQRDGIARFVDEVIPKV